METMGATLWIEEEAAPARARQLSSPAIDMRVLLFSTVVYLAGIAVVLFLRPTIMFDREGRWKEFGLRREDATVVPFWLFCIAWAVVSYFLGRISLPTTPVDWVQSASTAVSLTTAASGLRGSLVQPMEESAVQSPAATAKNLVLPLPVSGPAASATKGGRRRSAAAATARRLKQMGGGKKLPKGLYLYVGGGEDGEEGEESDMDSAPFFEEEED